MVDSEHHHHHHHQNHQQQQRRSKEALGMVALHEALRTVCLNTDWTYSVFWSIRPRPYVSLSFSLFSSPCYLSLSPQTISFCVLQESSRRWQRLQSWRRQWKLVSYTFLQQQKKIMLPI